MIMDDATDSNKSMVGAYVASRWMVIPITQLYGLTQRTNASQKTVLDKKQSRIFDKRLFLK